MRPHVPAGVRSGARGTMNQSGWHRASEGLKMASMTPATPDILSVFDRFFAPHSCSLTLFEPRERPTFNCIILAFRAYFHVPRLICPRFYWLFIVTPFSPFCQCLLGFPDSFVSSATNYFNFCLTKTQYYLFLRCRLTHKIQ